MENLEKHSIRQFNAWSKTYDTNFINFYYFYLTNKHIVKVLNPSLNASMLDVGFGTGILLEQLSGLDRNLYLTGLDISKNMFAVAEKNSEAIRTSN